MKDWLFSNPEIFALLILIVGWAAAQGLRYAVGYGITLANRASASVGQNPGVLINQRSQLVIQRVSFWLVLLSAVALAMQTLGVTQMADGLGSLVSFIPNLLFALAILTVGHIVGLLGQELIESLDQASYTKQLSKVAYGFVLLIAAVMALQQIGVDVSLLSELATVSVAFVLGSLGLAFGLGARQLVANLSAQRELSRYKVGDRLSVDGLDGRVVEVHSTGIKLATKSGSANIPANIFASVPVLHLQQDNEIDD